MAKLFGTDGVRGIANKELTPEIAFRLGVAAGIFLGGESHGKIVVGRDTRRSGAMLQSALVSGILSTGSEAVLCEIIPTPAIALLVREEKAAGGVVISASHNPPEYNGIKLFSHEGTKLSDDLEHELEEFVLNTDGTYEKPCGGAIGTSRILGAASESYVQHALATGADLKGLKIVVDCGHGAAYSTTPEAFRALGAEVVDMNTDFDGMDINVECGSTNLSAVAAKVKETSADLGIAHDGDADRVLAVDENGDTIDGDAIMAICAKSLKDSGKLKNNIVVSTVMANLGFDKAMEKLGIQVIKADVGDRYVFEQMKSNQANFGGEQSGHIIFLDYNSTGDGLVTAIQLVCALKQSGKKLSVLSTDIFQKYPQILVNVPVKNKLGFENNQKIAAAVAKSVEKLSDSGRVLVRPSGTESIIRVMAEAHSLENAQDAVDSIVTVVTHELG